MCAAELPPEEREPFLRFAGMLASLLHHSFHERIERIKDAYAQQQAGVLEQELEGLARAANFSEIDPAELDRALDRQSLLKLRLTVDRDAVERLLLFRRGESEQTRQVRAWFGWRRKEVAFTAYDRVLIYARLRDQARPLVKLFQDIPRDDLEMVFPDVRVRMRGIDKLLIGVPAVISGIVMIATKLITTLGLVLLLVAFWLGLRDEAVPLNQTALVTIGIGLFAFGAYIVRQITAFKNRKILFMQALAENLYFRNIDNDAGVFHHLLDKAEEAEVTEAVLAYHFLRTAPEPLTPSELDGRVEAWLRERVAAPVDFDIEDGLRKLRDHGLIRHLGGGRLTAAGLAEAKQGMDRFWDGIFDYHQPQLQ
jgi:hypothetical protein